MRKVITLAIVMVIVWQSEYAVFARIGQEQAHKTTEVRDLPFCALILRNFGKDESPNREVFILMDGDLVTEDNLRLLFGAISQKYPSPLMLEVWVYTDVEELATLATQSGHSEEVKVKRKTHQFGYYRRTKDVELFRYNPDFPNQGMKTVVLRGKE